MTATIMMKKAYSIINGGSGAQVSNPDLFKEELFPPSFVHDHKVETSLKRRLLMEELVSEVNSYLAIADIKF